MITEGKSWWFISREISDLTLQSDYFKTLRQQGSPSWHRKFELIKEREHRLEGIRVGNQFTTGNIWVSFELLLDSGL